MKRIMLAVLQLLRAPVGPICDWCDGTGLWNGYPCIKCRYVGDDPDFED
jgi:hypothetical protein